MSETTSAAATETIERFVRELRLVGASAAVLPAPDASGDEVADHLASFLKERGYGRVFLAPDPLLEELSLREALGRRGLEVVHGGAEAVDPHALRDVEVGITGALAAVAESGTLLLGGKPEGPWQWGSLLPPLHIALVRSDQICECLDAAFQRLREAFAKGVEEFVWITGPSRTADVAVTLLLGMHGPKELHVVVVVVR